MKPQTLARRTFLQVSGTLGGGLLLSFVVPQAVRAAAPETSVTVFSPNAFISIDRQGKITFTMPNAEMGQGIWTSSAMLIAEELEVGLDQVTLVAAPPDNALYSNALLGGQGTGGSFSTRSFYTPLREAGAICRTMLVEAAASRWNVDPGACNAARAVVRHAASGRSLEYAMLAEAAAQLPVPKSAVLKDPSQFTLIGTMPRRLDTSSKVNGSAVFGIDTKVLGMGIGTVSACPVKGGKLLSYNEAAAKAAPGVRDVVALEDAVAVIGDHMWAAQQGLKALAPVWDEGPNAGDSSDDMIVQLEAASKTAGVVAKNDGDAATIIRKSDKKFEVVYQLPFLAHAAMEPINNTLYVRSDGADLWVGTQSPVQAQAAVAKATGLPIAKITVHNQFMGGGFGRRYDVLNVTQAALIAKRVGYPVKLIWTREEDIQHDLYRPYYYDRVSASLDAEGKVTAWSHKVTGSSVIARWFPAGMKQDGKLDPDAVDSAVETPYAFPAQKTEWVRAEPKSLDTLFWRGVGHVANVFVVEGFIDELASAAGKDPVEFRRSLLKPNNPRALRVLNLAAEKAGWGGKLPPGHGRGVALQFAFNTHIATIIQVEVTIDGQLRVRRATVAVDCGPVVNPNTIEAQMQGGLIFGLTAALYGEITVRNGRVEQSNFHDYRMLRIDETPVIDVHIVNDAAAPIGGIGEAATVGAAPALGNAIYAASGRRLRRLPFTPGQLEAS